jgi:hypothetical protein
MRQLELRALPFYTRLNYASAMEPDDQPPVDYSFIVGDPDFIPPDTGKKKRMMMVSIGGGLMLLIFGVAFAVILSSGSNTPTSTQNFIAIAQTQEEMVRVSNLAARGARTQSTRNIAATITRSLNSSKQSVVVRLAEKGLAIDNATLKARENAATTKKLQDATQANRFDQVYLQIITEQLNDYQTLLENTFELAETNAEQELLKTLYADSSALLQKLSN